MPRDPMPSYMGGRASEVWPSTTRHVSYGLLLPAPVAPALAPSTEVAEVVEPAPEPLPHPTDTERDGSTDISADAAISIGKWIARVWLVINIRRRR
jgi:hypothetical protein